MCDLAQNYKLCLTEFQDPSFVFSLMKIHSVNSVDSTESREKNPIAKFAPIGIRSDFPVVHSTTELSQHVLSATEI